MGLAVTYRQSIYSTSAASSYATTGTYTPAANSLLVAFEVNSLASTPLEPTTFTGHGVTWTKLTLGSRLLSTTHSISVWVASAGASPSSAAATAGFNGVSQTGAAVVEFEVTGWGGASPSAAIIQNPTNTGTGTAGTVTLSAAGESRNRPLSFFVHLANEVTNPRANWTETAGADGNFNTPATGAEGQFRSDAFETTATATWTTSSAWIGAALEIKALIHTATGALSFSFAESTASKETFNGTGALAFLFSETGTGVERHTGTGAISFGPAIAASGKESFRGTGGLSFALSESATGSIATPVSGTAGVSFGPAIAATGIERIIGSGNPSFALAFNGSGKERLTSVGSLSFPLSISGVSLEKFQAVGSMAFSQSISSAGKAANRAAGSLGFAVSVAAIGRERIAGAGALSFPNGIAASGTITSAGTLGAGSLAFGYSISGLVAESFKASSNETFYFSIAGYLKQTEARIGSVKLFDMPTGTVALSEQQSSIKLSESTLGSVYCNEA